MPSYQSKACQFFYFLYRLKFTANVIKIIDKTPLFTEKVK